MSYYEKQQLKSYEKGGMKVKDFNFMNGMIKIKWLQAFMKHGNSSIWNNGYILFKKKSLYTED